MEIYDVDATELIEKTSQELKKVEEIKPPAWAIFVRTGHAKQRPPVRNDWWHTRAASILRKIAKLGPIGTSKLRTIYGSKKNRGVQPEKFYKGSGNIIRKILQQLEKAGLVKKVEKDAHKGRCITPKGISFLEKIASELHKQRPKPAQKPEAPIKPQSEAKAEEKPKAAEKAEPKKAEPKKEEAIK